MLRYIIITLGAHRMSRSYGAEVLTDTSSEAELPLAYTRPVSEHEGRDIRRSEAF